MLDEYIENCKNDIIIKTQELVQIPSVYSCADSYKYPFGKNINSALDYMLKLGKELGFRTKNIDNYCGYIEFGEGSELFAIIGHLDVVPAKDEEWIFPPFSGTIYDNLIYGRGVIDDKGPVIASLYAMKAVMDNYPINRRIRLILGLDEERDWKCIEYYKKYEEIPSLGFSPDGNFPCIFAEKTVLSTVLKCLYDNSKDLLQIASINSYSNPINVVPKMCTSILRINTEISNTININDLISNIRKIVLKYNFQIDIYQIDEFSIKITSHGKSAHSAHPELGINSISRLLIVIHELLEKYMINIPLLNFFSKYIKTEYTGKSLGIDFEDYSGNLTLNVSSIEIENKIHKLFINLRIPVTIPIVKIGNQLNKLTSPYISIDCDIIDHKPFLDVNKKCSLVTTLTNIFNLKTNTNFEPFSIGGATYARAFENVVSFGPTFPNDEDMCHKVNEFIDIDKLILCSKIYAESILKLNSDI